MEDISGWKHPGLHILTTSRKENDVEDSMKSLTKEQERIEIQDLQVNDDICAYVRNRIQTDRHLKRWQKMPEVQQEIEDTLLSKADGM